MVKSQDVQLKQKNKRYKLKTFEFYDNVYRPTSSKSVLYCRKVLLDRCSLFPLLGIKVLC